MSYFQYRNSIIRHIDVAWDLIEMNTDITVPIETGEKMHELLLAIDQVWEINDKLIVRGTPLHRRIRTILSDAKAICQEIS